ncbi:MAG: hypothetical protein KKA79_10185 [Nanoarchaeota archaeon]|nr:hypothetical protein [Nanoarchaeota archaeon]
MKEKKRYLIYEVKAEKTLEPREVKQVLEKKMLDFLGELGYGKAGIIIMDEFQDNRGIIRMQTKSLDNVKAALTLVKKIGDQKVIVKSVGVSGILNKAKSKFLNGGR